MIAESDFRPPAWLRDPHLQTITASQLRPSPPLRVRRERIELPDGDFLDLDWAGNGGGPVLLVLHGLAGSIRSKYARGLMKRMLETGWRAVLMHFRGASGEPNRLPRSYHSGETGDIDFIVRLLREREPHTPMAVAGYSLGGNVLLKWLGERGGNAPICAAAAVSVPFDLNAATVRMQHGLSRLYQRHLLRGLRAAARLKLPLAAIETTADLRRLRTFPAFDDHLTAPLHGFRDADDYYRRASSRPYLPRIRVPTLIVHALDDPFMSAAAVPGPNEVPDPIRLELSRHGGHVAFIAADRGGRPYFWLERRIPSFLRNQLLG